MRLRLIARGKADWVDMSDEGYLEALSEVCHRHDVLLIVDGVICAFGRVGTWFGYERWGMSPDMVVLAKGLTSGYLPLGAVLVSGQPRLTAVRSTN